MKQVFLAIFILLTIKTQAQSIQGKIIDEVTNQPIPFVSVGIVGTKTTSVSNENGEFIIKATSLPAKIRFSHVSYTLVELGIEHMDNNLTVKLKSASINLQEISVDPYKGLKLLKEAFTKAEANKATSRYLKAFYRQLSSVNGTATSIHEIFYDLKWNPNKAEGWIAQQTRFAEIKNRANFTLNNQSYFTFTSSGYLIENKAGNFVNLKNINKYDVEIDNYIEQEDQDIAVISCTFKNGKKNQYYTNSKYFIGVKDHKIYRLENKLFNLPLTLTGDISLKFPPIASTIATFKDNGTATTILESVATKMYLVVSNNQNIQFNINSLLTVINEDESLKSDKFLSVNRNVKDKNVVESIKYNADFWRNNPIVKQTALEDKFIKMMESQNAFGTMINP